MVDPGCLVTFLSIKRIYYDLADSYPQHEGKFFNFSILIEFFNYEAEKIKVLGIGAIFL